MPTRTDAGVSRALLHVIFALSGAAAILYQLIWQRVLFGLYGTNIESVTIVVTAFLVGLGAGSLIGGWLADRMSAPMLTFAALELGIGLCGLVSVPVFRWVGEATSAMGPAGIWAIVLALLVLPCSLMGATLPVLTEYVTDSGRNVGDGLGALYAANTLGSAVSAIAASLVVVGTLGQQGTVNAAASLNLLLAAVMAWQARRGPGR